jgi:hypothetical protein
VAIGRRLEALERPKAKERQKRPGFACSEKFTEQASRGQTRDKVGRAVGMSGVTYQCAKAVVDAADGAVGMKLGTPVIFVRAILRCKTRHVGAATG